MKGYRQVFIYDGKVITVIDYVVKDEYKYHYIEATNDFLRDDLRVGSRWEPEYRGDAD